MRAGRRWRRWSCVTCGIRRNRARGPAKLRTGSGGGWGGGAAAAAPRSSSTIRRPL
jgi:hypothetical protein